MIHYAGVTAYNEVQSDTPVAVDNGGSGSTGLTAFLERRVVVAIREVTRGDLHGGGPASREGTDPQPSPTRSSCGRRYPRSPSDRLPARVTAPSQTHLCGEDRRPHRRPWRHELCARGSTPLLYGMPSAIFPDSAPPPSSAGPGALLRSAQLGCRSLGSPRPSAARR